MNQSDFAIIFKALSDETRLKIIEMLSLGELPGCDILSKLEITQPTLSYHMKFLCDSKLVTGDRQGSRIIYTLNTEAFSNVIAYICRFNYSPFSGKK